MAAALINSIRAGQRQLTDRIILDLAVQRGLINETVTLSPEINKDAAAGAETVDLADPNSTGVGLYLVSSGQLSQAQLSSLLEEAELVNVMDTVTESAAPAEVQQAASQAGRRVGRYTLVDEIGAGGMGVVWRGWDNQLSRWVAVKQLKVNDSRLVARFMREASLLAQLTHPNITAVFEIGVHEAQPFLVMELVSGGTPVAEQLDRKGAARIVRDAARAVQYAHDKNMIHRDLKPSNLLIGEGGRVFVTDFGLARMREEDNSLTVSGALLGTPAFMAPEQAQGKDADIRTDVYGLGATLYALVENEPPYSGELVHEVVKRVAVSNPPKISGADDLVVVAEKAMERDREDRYQTAAELAEELQRYIDDEPIHAQPINAAQRLWRRAKRNPALSGSLFLAACLIIAVATWGTMRLNDYYTRQQQIEAASIHTSNAEGQERELRRIYAAPILDRRAEQGTLENLHRYADQALALAPGYAPAAYFKGIALLWQNEFDLAHQYFTQSLDDDPLYEDARIYRIVAEFGRSEAISPIVVHDRSGFRIVPPPDTPEKQAALARLVEDDKAIHPQSDRIFLSRAILQNARGDFAASVQSMAQYLQRFQADKKIREMLVLSLVAAGQFEQARTVAREMTAGTFPAHGFSGLAFAEAADGQLEAAVQAMQQSLDLEPNDDNKQWIATWRFQQGRYQQAMTAFGEILDGNPDHFNALVGRAGAIGLLAQGPDDELLDVAYADAQRAVALRPGDAYAQFVLGQASLYHNPGLAIKSHEQAIKLDAEEYGGHSRAMIASAHFVAEDYPAAAQAMGQALKVIPGKRSWVLRKAEFELLAEDYAGALQTLFPLDQDEESLTLMLRVYDLTQDMQGALTAALQRAELVPENVIYRVSAAEYANLAGDTTTSVNLVQEMMQTAGDNPAVLSVAANTWLLAGNLQAAQSAAEGLVRLDRATANDKNVHAQILLALGHGEQALDMSIAAIEQSPSNLSFQMVAGLILANLNRLDQADRYLRILTADPVDWTERAKLRCFLGQAGKAREDLQRLKDSGQAGAEPLQAYLDQYCPST